MARTIRFRAWDKQDAKMLIWGVHTGYIKDAMPDDMGDEWIERCELMQFTGLIDVAGNRIYESDIIRDRTGNHYEVKYDDGQWWAPLGLDTSYIGRNDCVVIGNVYENSELLNLAKVP